MRADHLDAVKPANDMQHDIMDDLQTLTSAAFSPNEIKAAIC
jgi:hypothetical protein